MNKAFTIILLLLLTITVFADESGDPCINICRGNTYYQGTFDERAGRCSYTTTECDTECTSTGCTSHETRTTRDTQETEPVAVIAPTLSNTRTSDGTIAPSSRTQDTTRTISRDYIPQIQRVPSIRPSPQPQPITVPTPRPTPEPTGEHEQPEQKEPAPEPTPPTRKITPVHISELTIYKNQPAIDQTATQEALLFGIIPITLRSHTYLNPTTRQEIATVRPWWSFLAKRKAPDFSCFTDTDCANNPNMNKCQGTPYCSHDADESVCRYKPDTEVTCPSENEQCIDYACNPKTGTCDEVAVPDYTPCADTDYAQYPCFDTFCKQGNCVGEYNTNKQVAGRTCQCWYDSDCAAYEDGNLCNGKLYCDRTDNLGTCRVNPATTVYCPSFMDTECKTNTCDPQTGTCAFITHIGKKCEGSHACFDSFCSPEGNCIDTLWKKDIQIGNNACQCQTNADCEEYDDGDKCNGTMYCDKATATCKLNPATVVSCPSVDNTACMKNSCVPETGKCALQSINEGESCGDWGCYDSTCTQGKCTKSWNYQCQCKEDVDCEAYDDGNKCNGIKYCNKMTGMCEHNPASVVNCQTVDDTNCLHNTCNPSTGTCSMQPVNEGKQCSFIHDCIDSTCSQGTCIEHWDYSNIFNGKSCECQTDDECNAKYDDGDKCNGTYYCNKQTAQCAFNEASLTACMS